MNTFKMASLLGVGLLVPTLRVYAQDADPQKPIQTDRPDFTDGAQTLEKGHFQIEAGLTRERSGAERDLTLGETELRFGTSSRSEVRVFVPSYIRERDGGEHNSGVDDPTLGMRYRLTGEKAKTTLAVIAESSAPLGSRRVLGVSDRTEPNLVLAAELPKLGAFSLSTNLGYARIADPGDHFSQFYGSLSAETDLSKHVGSFFEVYAFNRETSDGPVHKFVDTGLTYLLNSNMQVDARIGFGLNNHTAGPDYFYGVGIARRF